MFEHPFALDLPYLQERVTTQRNPLSGHMTLLWRLRVTTTVCNRLHDHSCKAWNGTIGMHTEHPFDAYSNMRSVSSADMRL